MTKKLDFDSKLDKQHYHWLWGATTSQSVVENNFLEKLNAYQNDTNLLKQKIDQLSKVTSLSYWQRAIYWVFDINNYAQNLILLEIFYSQAQKENNQDYLNYFNSLEGASFMIKWEKNKTNNNDKGMFQQIISFFSELLWPNTSTSYRRESDVTSLQRTPSTAQHPIANTDMTHYHSEQVFDQISEQENSSRKNIEVKYSMLKSLKDLGFTLSEGDTVTFDEIKHAYYKKARLHHPDRPGGNRELFDLIQVAYEKLDLLVNNGSLSQTEEEEIISRSFSDLNERWDAINKNLEQLAKDYQEIAKDYQEITKDYGIISKEQEENKKELEQSDERITALFKTVERLEQELDERSDSSPPLSTDSISSSSQQDDLSTDRDSSGSQQDDFNQKSLTTAELMQQTRTKLFEEKSELLWPNTSTSYSRESDATSLPTTPSTAPHPIANTDMTHYHSEQVFDQISEQENSSRKNIEVKYSMLKSLKDLGFTLSEGDTVTFDEIKHAYYKKARLHHPDRPGGNRELFDLIQVAYEKLDLLVNNGSLSQTEEEEIISRSFSDLNERWDAINKNLEQLAKDYQEIAKDYQEITKDYGIISKEQEENKKELEQSDERITALFKTVERLEQELDERSDSSPPLSTDSISSSSQQDDLSTDRDSSGSQQDDFNQKSLTMAELMQQTCTKLFEEIREHKSNDSDISATWKESSGSL